ncbi:MAG: winged helix-turn-helix transcriptional regulator [Pseudomonadota bacterium]
MPDMRFAPAPVLLAQKSAGGLNQMSVRGHNERLILDLLRREGTLSRLEIGQNTGLSAQTVSVLVRALLKEGLLLEGETSRGRVGPPTTPFSLHPEGAFALGIYAGARVLDACLMDFTGVLQQTHRQAIQTGKDVADQVTDLAADLLSTAPVAARERCLGLGLGVNQVHWSRDRGIGQNGWHPGSGLDAVEPQLTHQTGLPCYILDDTTSAATGHVLYGGKETGSSFLYCHVGARTQARVVLHGQAQVGHDEGLSVLPGLATLEEQLIAARLGSTDVWMGNQLPDSARGVFTGWVGDVACSLASVAFGLLAFLDIPRVVLVTSLAEEDRAVLCKALEAELSNRKLTVDTTIGHNPQWAKASGAAACVLSNRFTPDWGKNAAT